MKKLAAKRLICTKSLLHVAHHKSHLISQQYRINVVRSAEDSEEAITLQ